MENDTISGSARQRCKLRGGYYTPAAIAEFLAEWAVADPGSTVLEPSAGDGAFVAAVAPRLGHGVVDAIELDEAEAARIETPGGVRVTTGDVFAWYGAERDGTYDAVVGNPPFIRYQTWPEEHREPAFALMAGAGMHPNRLTNAWVPFVVLATRALRPGGRLAMVLPAELLQVSYAAELRAYLAGAYGRLTVITFRRLAFSGIQQEAVLVLGVRGGSGGKISVVDVEDVDGLRALPPAAERELDHASEKWTRYFLTTRELGLMRELEAADALTTLGALASVDVGIVTGRNEFFVLRPSVAEALGVRVHCRPLVGRTAHIPGVVLGAPEWQRLVDADAACLLLDVGRTPRELLPPAALEYVEKGEAAGYHEGYKCRIRQPTWWYVPSIAPPDAFLLRQIHDGPRIVANPTAVTCTDTIHRVRVIAGVDPQWLAAAGLNSVTYAFSEIKGRSYGGGVLELEPTEAEALLFPRPGAELPIDDLDHLVRERKLDRALDIVDSAALAAAGITASEAAVARGAWRRLSARRRGRSRLGA